MGKLGIGRIGELMAANYLKSKDWLILETNYSLKFGELDLVAKNPLGKLVFIEVKTSFEPLAGFRPEDRFSGKKVRNFKRMCAMFSAKHPHLYGEEGWQMDLIAITLLRSGKATLRHYVNI